MEAVSLVIRAWNEANELQRLISAIIKQDYAGQIELIVVDNGSTDDTVAVAERAGATIVVLSQNDFTYPKSLNVGIAAATHDIVVEIVAHALPLGPQWLASGLRHFSDPQVAGVYSPVIPFQNASIVEKTVNSIGYLRAKRHGVKRILVADTGVMGTTNVIIRKSVWAEHPFDELYAIGGEDEAWARWVLEKGYKLICDPSFTVLHSHKLGSINFLRQMAHWRTVKRAMPFDKEKLRAFRPDLLR
jgi:glycosyltransferase involved in cell wall biosynthesis